MGGIVEMNIWITIKKSPLGKIFDVAMDQDYGVFE